jgi:cytochrome c oxidase subunit 2
MFGGFGVVSRRIRRLRQASRLPARQERFAMHPAKPIPRGCPSADPRRKAKEHGVRGMKSARSAAKALRIAALSLLFAVASVPFAFAQAPPTTEPHNWQLGFQQAATPVKERIASFHDELLIIITLITIFVMGLLAYVIVRFNARANPVPTRTTHNTLIEVIWTVVPVLILVIIAIPSFKLMYYMDRTAKADMTIKVTGHQWYWSYEYPDAGEVGFDSNIIPVDQLKPGQKRLLDVDNRLIVPVDTTVRVLIIGSDVMHSWFVPSFGVQMYAVVGRSNESWFNVEKEGVYYGQCNQICGVNHAFMPIVVEAVSKQAFAKWVDEKKKQARDDNAASVRLAGAAPAAAPAQ